MAHMRVSENRETPIIYTPKGSPIVCETPHIQTHPNEVGLHLTWYHFSHASTLSFQTFHSHGPKQIPIEADMADM